MIKYLSPVFLCTRDMSHLPPWKQALYWRVFVPLLRQGYRLGLPVMVAPDGARVDIQMIGTTQAIAASIVGTLGEGAFYIPQVPVDVTLPKSAVVFGGNRAPYSEAASLYEAVGSRSEVHMLCPITRTICAQHDTVTRKTVENLYHRVKAAVAS